MKVLCSTESGLRACAASTVLMAQSVETKQNPPNVTAIARRQGRLRKAATMPTIQLVIVMLRVRALMSV